MRCFECLHTFCERKNHFFNNNITINSELLFSMFPHIFLFSGSRLSTLLIEFQHTTVCRGEEQRVENDGWTVITMLGYNTLRWSGWEKAFLRSFKITGGRHGSKPTDASFTKIIHKKKLVHFWVLTLKGFGTIMLIMRLVNSVWTLKIIV